MCWSILHVKSKKKKNYLCALLSNIFSLYSKYLPLLPVMASLMTYIFLVRETISHHI